MNQILMAAARGARIQEYNASENEWFEMDSSLPLAHDITDDYRVSQPTHWMPLPAAPKEPT